MGGSSTPSPQNNSPTNSLPPSPPIVDHDSIVTIDFDRIQSLEENLRYFEGFLNRENVFPQAGNAFNTLRDMLISDKRVLEMLRALSMIVKSHVPLEDASPQYGQSDVYGSQLSVNIPGLSVHMVDPRPTIHSINASTTLLGYMCMPHGLTFTSTTAQISTVSTSTTSVGGIGPCGGSIGGYGRSGPPPLPSNPVLNTILQNMGQL